MQILRERIRKIHLYFHALPSQLSVLSVSLRKQLLNIE